MNDIKKKLAKIISSETSTWVEKAEWRIDNNKWLDKSAKIALSVLRTIRERGMSQKQLADELNISPQQVSKIVKGQENFTLESISKLESILGISLVEIPVYIKARPNSMSYISSGQYQTAVTSAVIFNYKDFCLPIDCPTASLLSNEKMAANYE